MPDEPDNFSIIKPFSPGSVTLTPAPVGDPSPQPQPQIVFASHSYSGPIPEAHTLAQYETAFPGAADRILKMAEREAEHRHSQDRKQLDGNIEDARAARRQIGRGQYCGLVICITTVICAAICIVYEKSWGAEVAGGILGVGGLAGLVGVFIWEKKSEADAPEKKEKTSSTLNVVPNDKPLPLFDTKKS